MTHSEEEALIQLDEAGISFSPKVPSGGVEGHATGANENTPGRNSPRVPLCGLDGNGLSRAYAANCSSRNQVLPTRSNIFKPPRIAEIVGIHSLVVAGIVGIGFLWSHYL